MEANHFHFVIWASTDKVGDSYQDISYINLIMPTSDVVKALDRAKSICPASKRHFRVNDIVEHHPHSTQRDE